MCLKTEILTKNKNPSFKEAFKSNVRKRWPIYIGLVMLAFRWNKLPIE